MTSRSRRHQGSIDRLPSGRYRVRVVDPATGERVSIGSFDRKGKAETAFAAAITDQSKGGWVSPVGGKATLADYSAPWIESRLRIHARLVRA